MAGAPSTLQQGPKLSLMPPVEEDNMRFLLYH